MSTLASLPFCDMVTEKGETGIACSRYKLFGKGFGTKK